MSEPFTPEQEARIKAIVRELFPAIECYLDGQLAIDLGCTGGAPDGNQHHMVAAGAAETLHDRLRPSERADRQLDNGCA